MPIVGLTVSETGEVMQRLAVTTKVSIGEVVKRGEKTIPQKLDHFVFLRKGTSLEWEPDPELMQRYGAECREVWIVLLDDDINNVFRTELAWWTKTEKKCWGDGRNATRRTEANPDGEPWSPCGDTCLDFDAGACKPSGDLYFILGDFPRLGSVCKLHTTSYRSIRQIHSALEQIRTVTGGRLAGIRCKLVVRPEKASYMDARENKKKSTTIYALNIELSADDMKKLLGSMTQYAQLFQQTQRLLGDSGRVIEYNDDPEEARATEISEEFPGDPTAHATSLPPERPLPGPSGSSSSGVRQPGRRSQRDSSAAPQNDTAPRGPMAAVPANIPTTLPAERPSPGASASSGEDLTALITTEQRQALYRMTQETGWKSDEAKRVLKDRFGFDSASKITVGRYREVFDYFQNGGQTRLPTEPAPAQREVGDEDLPANFWPEGESSQR